MVSQPPLSFLQFFVDPFDFSVQYVNSSKHNSLIQNPENKIYILFLILNIVLNDLLVKEKTLIVTLSLY